MLSPIPSPKRTRIAVWRPPRSARASLSSLGLIDIHGQIVTDGEFAKVLLGALEKAGGKAVNRPELLTERDPGVLTWAPWHLEPAWLVLVAAARCHAGRLELGYPGGQIDALALDRLTKMSREELGQLTHIAPPKALPILALRDAAALLDIPAGAIPDSGANVQLAASQADSSEMCNRGYSACTREGPPERALSLLAARRA